ncbi:hypothetical protein [Halobacterium hubeiense]|uniref:hypothetical protein n=1 Tax=Halobacterium hubeiense TaxID=1407499 RepID=UPI0015C66274|nr:hypothetical protein [Halobacterium hubeiense]
MTSRIYLGSAILAFIAAAMGFLRIGPYVRGFGAVIFTILGVVGLIAWQLST